MWKCGNAFMTWCFATLTRVLILEVCCSMTVANSPVIARFFCLKMSAASKKYRSTIYQQCLDLENKKLGVRGNETT